MSNFLDNFESYEDCSPPGVRLPKINIENRHYDSLGVSKDISNLDFLKKLCWQGIKEKGIDKLDNKQEYYDRTKEELDILENLGFIDYILLNWDVLKFCHENDIPTGPGRGSAAGSLVLYLIDVTKIDSLKYDLFFERFVSKSRAKKTVKDGITYLDGSLLADVDNDISYEKRQLVIKYIEDKYPSRTCKILTLNTLSGKLCVKECGKIVAEMSEQDVNLVSSFIPKIFGNVVPLDEAYNESEKFKDWADTNQKAFAISKKLEGLNKNTGVHPSGIAISFEKLEDICPLIKNTDGHIVSGYDMNWVAELMVKFDILGLRTLSVIQRVCDKLNINMEEVDTSSYEKIYQHLDELKTPHGLFQIEASANYRVCRKIQPKTLEELSAVIAIGRPGALDFLDSYTTYAQTKEFQSVHSYFDDILGYTGGIPLYQEQLMKMAVKVGFSLDESEQLRRIVGKKKVKEMPKWKSKIEQKVIDRNLPHEVGEVLWKVAEDSANYSFNKSHSIAYATLAAWTTYLKFNYPQEFFIALLEMAKFEPTPHEEIRKVSHELHHFSIQLLNPDLSKSKMGFKKEGKNIRFGLNSIKGISEKSLEALESFIDSESSNKYDIFLSAKQAGLNIGILSSLIQAGTLSGYDKKRSVLVLEAQTFNLLTDREKRNVIALGEKFNYDVLKTISSAVKDELVGDDGKRLIPERRFETIKKKYGPYKEIYEKNKKYEDFANWFYENKLLGYSYSSELKDVFKSSNSDLLGSQDFNSLTLNHSGRFIGVIEDSVKRTSRNGNQYVKMTVFDEKGTFDAMISDNARYTKLQDYYERGGKTPSKENIIVLYGKKGEDILFVDEMSVIDKCIHMKLSDLK